MQLNGHELIIFLSTLSGSGLGIYVAGKLLKKVSRGHLDNDIHKVVITLSAIAGYLQYADQLHAVLPPYFMGVSVSSIYGFSQIAYKVIEWSIDRLTRVQAAETAPALSIPVTTETPLATPPAASF